MSYYLHIDDFDGVVTLDNAMSSDVKRLISHSKYNYRYRHYFFSPSQRAFYIYYKDGNAYTVYNRKANNSLIFTFIPDEGRKLRDCITVSDRFMKRIENMNKLILPNQRTQ